MKKHRYVGLDVHKESIAIAVAEGGRQRLSGVASKHLTMSCQIEEKQERELLQVKCTMFRRDPYFAPPTPILPPSATW